jgi:hypothetical protein
MLLLVLLFLISRLDVLKEVILLLIFLRQLGFPIVLLNLNRVEV